MSFAETLHQARKARLQRIAARAVVQAPADASSARAHLHIARPAPDHRIDRDYERAWAFEILGVRDPADRWPQRLKIEDIQRAAAQHFGLQRSDILSTRRAHVAARPRHVAMYLARVLTAKSYPEIGRCFGRDHATVLHAVRGIEGLLAHDSELAASVDRIRAALQHPEGRP